jgi:hypothetical protein
MSGNDLRRWPLATHLAPTAFVAARHVPHDESAAAASDDRAARIANPAALGMQAPKRFGVCEAFESADRILPGERIKLSDRARRCARLQRGPSLGAWLRQ